MRRRIPLLVLPILLLCLVLPAAAPRSSAAQPADGAGLAVVRAAYDILLDRFYGPLDGPTLLTAGWEALTSALRGSNQPAPPALGPLPPGREAAFAVFSVRYTSFTANLPRGVTASGVAFTVTDGMAASVNEGHTAFVPPESYRSYLAQLGGNEQPAGLGIRWSPGGGQIVTAVAPNGPADRAGVRPGDRLTAIDGAALRTLAGRAVTEALNPREGVTVTLGLARAGATLALAVTAGPYAYPPLTSRLLADRVGYLRLERFVPSGAPLPDGTELLAELDRQLDALDAAGARALVLDLRGNPGGSVFATTEILGRFLPEDVLTVNRADTRGHESTGLAGGRPRAVQLPMAVLVNGRSASASEVTAATLRESGRAILVGQRTAGVLATSQILPLPDGAAVQVAMAEVLTGIGRVKIDRVGFPVDVEVADSRTDADYLTGRDPQLEAAVAALASAPAPPSLRPGAPPLPPAELRALLAGYMPAADQIPTSGRLSSVVRESSHDFTHPNQWINYNGPARDPLALQATLRRRGWLGGHVQEYALRPLVPPGIGVGIDLYGSVEGAQEAIRATDFPDLGERVPAPLQIGEEQAAYRGVWMAQGGVALSWRRGQVVLTVGYYDIPGYESWDTALAVARLVDAAYLRNPLPIKQAQPAPPAYAGVE